MWRAKRDEFGLGDVKQTASYIEEQWQDTAAAESSQPRDQHQIDAHVATQGTAQNSDQPWEEHS